MYTDATRIAPSQRPCSAQKGSTSSARSCHPIPNTQESGERRSDQSFSASILPGVTK